MATQNEVAAIATLEEQAKQQNKTLGRLEEKFDSLVDKLDKRYAARWVQTIVSGFIAAILLGFAGVVVNHFIPNNPSPVTSTAQTSKE